MRALLIAGLLGGPEPELGRIEFPPARAGMVTVEDGAGEAVASVQVRSNASAVVYVPSGDYVVRGEGEPRVVHVEPGASAVVDLPGRPQPPAAAAPALTTSTPVQRPAAPPAPALGARRSAWRAPFMSAFVPGLGHAWAGKPLWGVGILAATAGAVTGAVVLGLGMDPSDGATPSDAGRAPGYARLGGFAALTSVAGALYVGQIFDAHRVEKGDRLRPVPGRVQLRFDRLTAVAMAPGRPRASLYDDLSMAAMVRFSSRVRVGVSDASVKLGPQRTVLQLGVRAMAQVYGPTDRARHRRFSLALGGGVMGQLTSRSNGALASDAASGPTERAGAAVPYILADARLFVAPRWSVGALGRFGVPLTTRYYAGRRALPAYAPTLELGVSLGVNL